MRPYYRLRQKLSDIRWGIHNMVRWTPVIWGDADFDWAYLAKIMEFKLRNMAARADVGIVQGSERSAKEMRIAAHILKRLQADDYMERCLPLGQTYEQASGWKWPKHADAVAYGECELLGKLITRKMRGWWD